jgi:C-terminal processing protease CtpA/Prc
MVFTKMMDKPYGELQPDSNHSWPVTMALLCDRSTYSAASFEAMLFKDQKMGIIAGEETGGRASSFGDIEHITLPNSRLVCGIATGYFPRRAGYDDGRGVLPDLPLDVTLDDSVLVEKICDCIRKPGGQTSE